MDVHRSRFVPYPTSSITTLAFSRSSDSGYDGPLPALRLAIGRVTGEIEIWNPLKGFWMQETVIAGERRSVDGLAWTQDPDDIDSEGNVIPGQQRLFSIASSPAVTEWDLSTGEVKRRSTGNFSEVWCFGVQPRWRPGKSTAAGEEAKAQGIVAGCGDGTLVLLSTAEGDLTFKKFLARVSGKKSRCMCITYQNRDIVAAGFQDTIRIYDTRNGHELRQMSLGVALPGAPKNPFVWVIKTLANGDIVSGDSNGEVRIWDGKDYSLIQRMMGTDSDCLDLATSADGKTIFSGNLDGKIAVFRQSVAEGGRKSWAKVNHRRLHTKEVKALASFDTKSGLSVVVTGGNDAAPVLVPLREYGKENVRALPGLPQDAKVISAPKARLMASWWEKDVRIWRVARQGDDEDEFETSKSRKLVAKIALGVKKDIRSVSMSSDGRLLAVSTGGEIKVFQLRRRMESDMLAIRKIELTLDFATLGARLLSFSPDGRWLAAVTPDNEVHIARFTSDVENPKKLKCLPETVELDRRSRKLLQSAYRDYDQVITRIAFSPDSAVLVTSDLSGHLDSWVLEGHEDPTAPAIDKAKHDPDKDTSASDDGSSGSDSDDDDEALLVFYGQHWTDHPSARLLPRLDSAPLVLSFRPTPSDLSASVLGNPGVHSTRHNPHAHSHALPPGPHHLVVLTAKHELYEIDVDAGKLTDWSRRNPTAALPDDFRRIKDRAVGSVWDSASERWWLYGTSWVFMLDLGQDLSDREIVLDHKQVGGGRKRRRKSGTHTEEERKKARQGVSGAGDPVTRYRTAPDYVKRTDETGVMTRVKLGEKPEVDEDVDVEMDDGLGVQLTRVRSTDGDEVPREEGEKRRKWWCTFKYRPILGMVPLEDVEGPQAGTMLEVAIVERPL